VHDKYKGGYQPASKSGDSDEYDPSVRVTAMPDTALFLGAPASAKRFLLDNTAAVQVFVDRLGVAGTITDATVSGIQAIAVLDHTEFSRFHSACVTGEVVFERSPLKVVRPALASLVKVEVGIPSGLQPRSYRMQEVTLKRDDCMERLTLCVWTVCFSGRVVGVVTCVSAPVTRDGAIAPVVVPIGMCCPLQAVVAMETVTGIPRTSPAFLFPSLGKALFSEDVLTKLSALEGGVDYATLRVTHAPPRFGTASVLAPLMAP
jgi:hypothetical protein